VERGAKAGRGDSGAFWVSTRFTGTRTGPTFGRP